MNKISTLLAVFFVLLVSSIAFAQERVITGKVTDSNKEPLPGATVLIKGTTMGTVADAEGEYRISVSKGATLIFSLLGYSTKEVLVQDQTRIEVALEEDSKMLSEVVVVGYAKQEVQSFSGASVQVAGKQNANGKPFKTWARSGINDNQLRVRVGDSDTLETRGVQVAIQVEGFRARVLIEAIVYNSENRVLEGNFQMKLPNGASPYYFAFGTDIYVAKNGRQGSREKIAFFDYEEGRNLNLAPEMVQAVRHKYWQDVKQARVVPKVKAIEAYQATVENVVDPMLAEWAGADIFNCKVYPLQPKKQHRIVIGYDVNLLETPLDRVLEMDLPTAQPLEIYMRVAHLPETKISVHLKGAKKDQDSQASYYSLKNPEEKRLTVRYEGHKKPILLTTSPRETEHFFGASFPIPLESKTLDKTTDAVLMLDVSLSSAPDKYNIWLATAEALLKNNPNNIKNFAVLFFNVEGMWWQERFVPNTAENRKAFLKYARKMALEGATDVGLALKKASALPTNANKTLFLLSDASATWGEKEVNAISENLKGNDQVFGFKTGMSETNQMLLEHLARKTGGAVFSILGEDEVQTASKAFLNDFWEIMHLAYDNTEDILLQGRPKFVYAGQKLVASGRGTPSPTATLDMKLRKGNETQIVQIHFEDRLEVNLSKRIYGQQAVEQLESLDYLTTSASEKYATYFQVAGQTSSFLMLDTENNYTRFRVEKSDTLYIQQNKVNALISEVEQKGTAFLGKPKAGFLHWITALPTKMTQLSFRLEPEILKVLERIPDERFVVSFPEKNAQVRSRRETNLFYASHLKDQKAEYAFLFQEAERLVGKQTPRNALKAISNLIEKNPQEMDMLRDVAFALMEWGMSLDSYSLWKRVLDSRPHEPQAYLALAQIYGENQLFELSCAHYETGLGVAWGNRFGDFNTILAFNYIALLEKNRENTFFQANKEFFEKRIETLKKQYNYKEADLLVLMAWNTDNSDMDLHVIEPTGEECYYQHKTTKSGGAITLDATSGYGPEMYVLPQALKGIYSIKAVYYRGDFNRMKNQARIYTQVYRNFGRPNQTMKQHTIVLSANQNTNNNEDDEDGKTRKIAKIDIQ